MPSRALRGVGVIDTGIGTTCTRTWPGAWIVPRVVRGQQSPPRRTGAGVTTTSTARTSRRRIAANHSRIGIDGVAPDTTSCRSKAANSETLIYPVRDVRVHVGGRSHGVDIVNNSYSMDVDVLSPKPIQAGGGRQVPLRSIAYAQSKGLAVIASAGNEGCGQRPYDD